MSYDPPKTLDEIKALPVEVLLPKHIYKFLGCAQYAINCQAQNDPEKLGYPVSVAGSRVRIPKAGFIAWVEGQKAKPHEIITERR